MKSTLLALFLSVVGMNAFAQAAAPTLTTIVVNDEKENLLADSSSRTLYTFDVDKGQVTSMCTAKCAELWPAYILTAQEAAGVNAPFGVIVRESKQNQLTYNGQPVYTYALDRGVPADSGDGVGGVWHYIVVKP
jgi:predicted lipoprotein with Yx(FWY)xxD motif